MYNAKFIQSLLIRVSFITALLDNAHFSNMKISNTTFAGASLAQSNFIGTVWDKSTVDFTNANLTEAILSDEQLENSTLDNCILPNKTWGPIITRNLVINGDIKQNCTSSSGHTLNGWTNSQSGAIRVYANDINNLTQCYFQAISFNSNRAAFVIQTFSLKDYTLLISTNKARYNFSAIVQCFGLQKVTMTIRFYDVNGLRDLGKYQEAVNGTDIQVLNLSNIVRYDSRQVQLTVTMIRPYVVNDTNTTIDDNNTCVCYGVNFMITKED